MYERSNSTMAESLQDAVYGCLMGGAVGDALGAPAESHYPSEIHEKYGRIEDLLPYTHISYASGVAGGVTDDTTLKHYMCLAIVEKGGRITPDDAAQVWLTKLNPDRFWSPDKISYLKMKAGMNPWDAGRGNIPSACATMGMPPIGIINAGDPKQAFQDGYCIAGINGDDFNRDGPALIAAGVAAALIPGATWEQVLHTMEELASPMMKRGILLVMDLLDRTKTYDAFRDEYYRTIIDWWSRPGIVGKGWRLDHFSQGTTIESVPLAMALVRLCEGDVNEVMLAGANFGRDADSLASTAGSFSGAIQGAMAIRPKWIEQVEAANTPFFEEVSGNPKENFSAMATRLVEAIRSHRDQTSDRLGTLDRILKWSDGENSRES